MSRQHVRCSQCPRIVARARWHEAIYSSAYTFVICDQCRARITGRNEMLQRVDGREMARKERLKRARKATP